MKDEILIEGVDAPEMEEVVRLIEAGMYDLSGENINGWFDSLKKMAKKAVAPLTKSLKPVADLAKVATNVPVLSNFIPGKGLIKMGLGMFDDISKIEKHTGKKINFRPKAVKNLSNAWYLKGYKEGRSDEAKEHENAVKNTTTTSRSLNRGNKSSRFSGRRGR